MTFWQTIWSFLGGITSQRNAGTQALGPPPSDDVASNVTEETALQVSAVWACVKLLAETVASLPRSVYEDTPNGPVDLRDHWFLRLLDKPNRYQTGLEFMETMMLNLVLHGNAYARITRVAGRPTSLLPLMASQVEVELLRDGSVAYTYTSDGSVNVYAAESIWHLKLYGNGIVGNSPLAFARRIVGIAQAADTAVTKIYKNGAKPSGVISFDRALKPEQREQIRANFDTLTTGDDNRLMVLEAGAKFESISMSPQDIELLSSRRFQLEEIARWFGVPSVMINDTAGSTTWGSGIEQIVTGFYKLNLRPYLERIEASAKIWLLTDEEDRNRHFALEFEGLLRSDLKTRLEGYRTAIQGSIMTPNEARAVEGWPALPGGDDLLAQINMAPVEQLGQSDGRKLSQVEAVQKVYLGVDKVVTSDEARQMINQIMGTDFLEVPGPEFLSSGARNAAETTEPTGNSG